MTESTETARSGNNPLFSFKGRIGRGTYWAITLTIFVISLGLQLMAAAVMATDNQTGAIVTGLLIMILFIPMTWIAFAAYCKRWHDMDQSGWLTLLMLIPLVNFALVIFLGIPRGTDGPNRYGEDPLAAR